MKDKEKIKELIKQEIERRIKNLEFSLENNCVEKYSKLDILGNITTLKSLLQFIDSLSEEPTSEDLEEACDNYYDETWDEHGGITMVINNCHDIWFPSQAMEDFFKAGANWRKHQMMKNAVDATVHNGLHGSKYIKEQDDDVLNKALEKYNPGDKVKIMVVKEEQ